MKRGCAFSLKVSRTLCKSSAFRLPSLLSTYLLLPRKVTLNPSLRRVSAIFKASLGGGCCRCTTENRVKHVLYAVLGFLNFPCIHQCLNPIKGACSIYFGDFILTTTKKSKIVISNRFGEKSMMPLDGQKTANLSNAFPFKNFLLELCRYASAAQKVCCLLTA